MSSDDRPLRPVPASVYAVNWLLVILLILLAAVPWRERGGRIGGRESDLHNPEAREPPVVPRGDLAEDEKSTIALFKQAAPSVVHIMSLSVQRDPLRLDVLGIPKGSGSGI